MSHQDRPEGEEASLEVSEVKGPVESLEEQRAFLLAHTENLEREIQRLRHEARGREAELTARLAEREARLAQVLGSRSWRWMAPLRAAGEALRGLLGGARR